MFIFSFKNKVKLIGVLAVAYFCLVAAFMQLPDNKFHIYFLNVGQGDAILIKTPENHQILIDGGPQNFVLEELTEIIPFFDKSIDLLVLSHPHADHLEGLIEVLGRFKVERVLYTGVNFSNSVYDQFLRELEVQNVEVFIAESKTDFKFGDVFLDIIYPFDSVVNESFKNVNNSSVGMKVIYKENTILLTGDLEIEAETEILEEGVNLKADIYKAGHHGSRSSSSWEFLEKIMPEVVVIQSGEGNSYGHPHPETIRNFFRANVKSIYRNDLMGRIEFEF